MEKRAISNKINYSRLKFTDPTLEKFVPLKSLSSIHDDVSFKYIYYSFPGYFLSTDTG